VLKQAGMFTDSHSSSKKIMSNSPGLIHLREVIERLIKVLIEENRILDHNQIQSLDPLIQKKGQLLLELMRAQKHIHPGLARSEIRTDVLRLRHEMSMNKQKLAIHFAATKDITDALLDVLRHNESDGTYQGWADNRRLKQ
jgi:hypothetical protein